MQLPAPFTPRDAAASPGDSSDPNSRESLGIPNIEGSCQWGWALPWDPSPSLQEPWLCWRQQPLIPARALSLLLGLMEF